MTARCYVTVAVLALLLSPGFAESLFMDSCTYLFDNGSATDMSGLMAAGMSFTQSISTYSIGFNAGICNRSAQTCTSTNELITGKVSVALIPLCIVIAPGAWSDTSVSLIDKGVRISYPQGTISIMTFSKTIKVNFIMVCNPDVPTYTYKDVNIDTTDTGFVMDISFYTKHGCLLPSKTNFERFLVYSKGRYILGPLAILIGIPLAIFSVKIYTMATFIMTALFVCVLVTCGVYAIPVTFAPWVGYPVVIVAILAGLVVSFLLRIKAPSLPKFCVGGVAGMVATLWLSIAVLAYLHSVVFYIAAPVLIIIGAIAAKLKSNTTFLVSTAATGSCLFVHGVSAFIGGYWHDIEFYREHTAKTTGDNDYYWTTYVYFGLSLVIAAVSVFLQKKLTPPNTEEEREAFFAGSTEATAKPLLAGLPFLGKTTEA